jgi:Ca2+-binding RTX toxin-like protein
MAIPFFNLSDLTGSNGFPINGVNQFDTSGFSVSAADDINGDGIDDIIIGAPGTSFSNPDATNSPGYAYVVFGRLGGFAANVELSALNGTDGFAIKGIGAKDGTGVSVSSAGDVNADGVDDVIIGARFADANNLEDAGSAFVVYGSKSGFAPTLNLSDLNSTNGFTINGIAEGNETGVSVSGVGDINGDGIDDVGIGSLYADPNGLNDAGVVYVVLGNQDGFSDNFDLNQLDGTNGFTINGIAEGNETGVSVSGAGDFNGDGIDDLIIGASFADPNGNYSGSSYVIYGDKEGFASTLNLSTLDGNNGFAINGANAFDLSGKVSDAGDVNGDGFDDVIIGAYGANDFAGTSVVLFGSDQAFSPSFNLSQINGTNGFAINGISPGDFSGFSVSSAGDFNGDGFDEVIIGAPQADPNGETSGQNYLIYGKAGGFPATINLNELDGTDGFALNGVNANDFSAISVSAGDINGDGLSDLYIGASYADPNGKTNAGSTYVIYGRKSIEGDAGNNTLNGTISDDTIYAGEGNDQIFGSEGFNMLFGEDGNDSIYGGSATDWINGGKGNDDIFGAGGNNQLFGQEGNDILYSGSGNDFIDGGMGNDHIWLGGGLDTVVLASGEGFDMINNFQVGQTTLGLSGGLTFEDLNIVSRGNFTLIEVAASGEDLARIENQSVRVDILEGSFAIV